MAASRKSSARPGKAGKPSRSSASSRSKPAKSAKAAKPAVKKSKAAEAKAKPAKSAAKVVAKATPKKGAKPAVKVVPAKAVKARPIKGVARVLPPPVARPIGVLPPESRARTSDRPPVAAKPKVAPAAPARPTPVPNTPQGAQRVTEKDLKEFEERLQTERRKIEKEMGHLEATVLKVNPRDSAGDLSGYSFHMADAGTDAMEREKAFLFASTEGRLLMEITEALRRLYRGEYGTCESCGNPIARARLEAMPHARLCVSCKEKEERAGRSAQ
jgi:RNA polymerase-binding protein DksA